MFRIRFSSFSPASTLIHPLRFGSKVSFAEALQSNSIFNLRALEVKYDVSE